MMRFFKAFEIGFCLRDLERLCAQTVGQDVWTDEECQILGDQFLAVLTTLLKVAEQTGLDQSRITIGLSIRAISGKDLMRTVGVRDPAALRTEARHVSEALLQDLRRTAFISIDPDRRGLIEKKHLFGKVVSAAFPSAIYDISEAGNCLAVECNTAAVFHLMRVVEWGMRALASHLGVKRVLTTKKSGKRKYTPIAYNEWERILASLQNVVDAKMTNAKRGATRQKMQEFYYPALQDIRGIRDAWRNHVMHTRAEYTQPETLAIMSHVKRLMINLAGKIREV